MNVIKENTPIYKNITKKKFNCTFCNKIFTTFDNLKYHINNNVCTKDKTYKCNNCNKIFSLRKNLNYHINNNVCKKNNYNNPNIFTNNKIDILNISTEDTSPKIINNITNNNNNTTNNNIMNNTINNIIINVNNLEELNKIKELIPFHHTKYNSTPEQLFEYLQNPNNAIQKIIINTHFNEEKPEYMNILNTNRKDSSLKIYDYDHDHDNKVKWITRDKDDICEILYCKCVNEVSNVPKNMKQKNMRIDPLKEFALNSKVMDIN